MSANDEPALNSKTCCASSEELEALKDSIISEYKFFLITEIHKTMKQAIKAQTRGEKWTVELNPFPKQICDIVFNEFFSKPPKKK